MFDSSGEIIRWFGSNTDIDELIRTNEQLKRLSEELEQKVLDRTSRLEAVNKDLVGFSYSISHDLRAPLRSIDGFSKALLEDYADKVDDRGKDFLNRVRNAAQTMGTQIDAVLGLSRIDHASFRAQTVDLSGAAEGIVQGLRTAEPERTVDVVVDPGMTATGDAHLLRLLIQNLLENAWKFTSKRQVASIEFRSFMKDGTRVYAVKDNGAGFDKAHASKLFAPFQRLHSSDEFPGTGIGLSSARRIIHRHHGAIWAEGTPGGGATFYFRFEGRG
jgi:light-regulated signal transduction histidine kinase (bacteriophytochrome)